MFSIRVYDRSDNPVALPAGLVVQPVRWAWNAVGGPADAEIEFGGIRDGLLALAGWLGYRIEIQNADGERVWWGDIEACEVAFGGLAVGVSLENLANRVQVRYSQRQAGGGAEAADTAWAADADSVARFGTFERRVNATQAMTATEAEALRFTALTRYLAPGKVLRVGETGQGATLRAVGYWQRMRRVYYSQPAGLIEHTDGTSAWPIGLGFTSSTVAFAASPQTINELYGRLLNFGYTNLQIKVAGSTANDGAYTLAGADRKTPVAYTATTIHFALNDDMMDSANGLAFMAADDIVLVSGSAYNDATYIIKTTGAGGVEVSPGYSRGCTDEGAGPSVTIRRGNAVVTTAAVSNEPTTAGPVTVTAYGQGMYQTFTLPSSGSWTVATVELKVRAVGSPSDSLRVQLYSDSSGSPGTLLETQDVLGSALPTGTGVWTAITFANTTAITYGTTYGIVVSRTGANDPNNYYEVDIDTDAGYSGALKVYDGAAWQTPASAFDMLFRVLGGVDLATQVGQMVLASGTELAGVVVESAAGVVGNQYRDGEQTAIDEAEALLAVGTSGGFRMLAQATAAEYVRILDEPLPSEARYLYTGDGRLLTLQGQPAPAGTCPAGEYVHLDNSHLLPGSWSSLSPFLVERATYEANSGRLTLEPAGMLDNFEIGLEGG